MTAIASTSPVPVHYYGSSLRHHPSGAPARSNSSRQQIKRSPAALESFRQSYARPSDSSDDEDLAPIKLSAEAQALLEEEIPHVLSDRHENVVKSLNSRAQSEQEILVRRRDGSPIQSSRHPAASRPSPPAALERDGSFAYKYYDKSKSFGALGHDSKTPATRLRKVRVSGSRSQTKSPCSAEAADRILKHGTSEDHTFNEKDQEHSPRVEELQNEPATVARSTRKKEGGSHSTIRGHRIGTGTLLNGHVRRRAIRRLSQEEELQDGYGDLVVDSPEVQQGRRAEQGLDDRPEDLLIDYGSPQPVSRITPRTGDEGDTMKRSNSPVPNPVVRSLSPPRPISFSASVGRQPTPVIAQPAASSRSSSSKRPVFKIPSLPPVEATNDQENEPPPTFRRGKPVGGQLEIHASEPPESEQKPDHQHVPDDSPRQPLALRHSNTPHRAAPAPPPKMSLIEAATSNAGNSRAKKPAHYVVNGRTFRRLDCIGKGGSSRVFRIMAENYKIFALKRVNLEEADDAAREGYMGEIQLLKKLENVDRVVRLFDYEINAEKGSLNVLMELGETDFNKMLNEQVKSDGARLNIAFVRHYWKEMLECVSAIHEHDIVHSDLKPPNFLLVKGQLKLIDFGIANAIQNHTVNVYRENQIGTPNYMSPESLVCHRPIPGRGTGAKSLRLGKPSDVWSLGCILYQMTYGQPPFAHIAKPFEKIMSIPDPKVEIQFPNTGIGGAVVPFGLIKTLKKCLQREQALRPTIRELLSDADPFLNPVAISPNMLERVVGNVINYCRKQEEILRQQGRLGQEGVSCLPRDEDMRKWPLAFYEKLKQAQEEGTAW